MPAEPTVQKPICLADYTSAQLMLPELRGDDVPGVVQELCQALRKEERVPDLLPFYHAVLVREYLVDTVLGSEIAFPHARINGIAQTCFALGHSTRGRSRGRIWRSLPPMRPIISVFFPR